MAVSSLQKTKNSDTSFLNLYTYEKQLLLQGALHKIADGALCTISCFSYKYKTTVFGLYRGRI